MTPTSNANTSCARIQRAYRCNSDADGSHLRQVLRTTQTQLEGKEASLVQARNDAVSTAAELLDVKSALDAALAECDKVCSFATQPAGKLCAETDISATRSACRGRSQQGALLALPCWMLISL